MNHSLDAAVLVAVLAGGGIYLCLSRRFLRLLFGFLMLSNAANLALLAISGNPSGRTSALVGKDGAVAAAVDPLPQALILTAIVIGFAVATFLTVLLYRLYVDRGAATVTSLHRDPAPGGAAREEREVGS